MQTHPADAMHAEIIENARTAIDAGRTNVDGVDVASALAHVQRNARGTEVQDAAAALLGEMGR